MTKSSTILKRARKHVERGWAFSLATTSDGCIAPGEFPWLSEKASNFCPVGAVLRELKVATWVGWRMYPMAEYADRGKPHALRLFDKAIELAEAHGD